MKSVESQLIDFLKSNPSVWSSGSLQRLEWKNKNRTIATPRSIVRRLEENTYTKDNPQGELEVSYINNHAHYRIREEFRKKVYRYEPFTRPDGTRAVREVLQYA